MELNAAAIGRKLESDSNIDTGFSGLYSTFSESSRSGVAYRAFAPERYALAA